MHYSVILEPIAEAGFEGYYYAHIPSLDLTTHGKGIDGALTAAKELAEGWIAEKRAQGEPIPEASRFLVTHIEVADALLSP